MLFDIYMIAIIALLSILISPWFISGLLVMLALHVWIGV